MKIKFRLSWARWSPRVEIRKVQGMTANGDYLVRHNSQDHFVVHPQEVREVIYELGDVVQSHEITADDIAQAYKAGKLSRDGAFKELVHEHCLSAGNADAILDAVIGR
jgi:hypothetical protein